MTIKAQTDSQANEKAELYILAAKHRAISRFLLDHYRVLVDLSYNVMADNLGVGYGQVPYVDYHTGEGSVDIYVYGPDTKKTMGTVRRAIGGQWNKVKSDWEYAIERQWGHPGVAVADHERAITLKIVAGDRQQVCQKVVTGVEEIHHDAREAYTETREKVEWVCTNLLDD